MFLFPDFRNPETTKPSELEQPQAPPTTSQEPGMDPNAPLLPNVWSTLSPVQFLVPSAQRSSAIEGRHKTKGMVVHKP